MLRKLHGLPGLVAAVLLLVLAISGAVLSIVPALERSAATIPAKGEISIAELAERILTNYPSTEQIKRSAAGEIIVYHNTNGQPAAVLVNPINGQAIAAYQPSAWQRWLRTCTALFCWVIRGGCWPGF